MKPGLGRLKTRREFLRVAAARRKRVMPGLILQGARRRAAAAEPQPRDREREDGVRGDRAERVCEAIRVGFTASRKVGKAVARNRARRRLRAAAVEVIPNLGRPGYDYVLVARKATLERPYGELVADLRRALSDLEKNEAGGRRRSRRTNRPAGRSAAEDRT